MIEKAVVDGIPALLAPTSGPTRGGITFRVGHADEPLARSGITHLIEHLALHRLGMTDYHYNGFTGSTVTHFLSQGSAEDVGRYLTSVCDALADLPWHRLDMEKEILRTEAAGKSDSPAEPLLLWRYGSRGYGVGSYPEWGLPELTADDLRAWLARYFTRDNAVLWFAGAAPENLRVNLPAGARVPLPEVTSALPQTPAFFAGSPRTIGFHTVLPRGPAAQMYAEVLERELFRSLRQRGGYSYAVGTTYDPLDPDTATVLALADSHPDKQDAALGGFIDVLAKLRWGNIERTDIDGTLAKVREAYRDPDIDGARLPALAFNALTGGPLPAAAEVLAGSEAVTVDDVHAVAERALAGGLLMVPEGRTAEWAGFVAAPGASDTVVAGQSYPMRNNADRAVVLGNEGVSLTGSGAAATVHFAQCAVMLAYPDGGRMLVGYDGIICPVEPTVYELPPPALAALDAAMPGHLVVRMPARKPDAIPKPPSKQQAATAPGAPRTVRFRRLTVAALVVLSVLTLGCVLFSIAGTGVVFTDPEFTGDHGSQAIVLIVFWGFTGFGVTLCLLLARRARRAWRS